MPSTAPSSLNCTPATPMSSAAVAETTTVPLSMVPPAGLVISTVGGVVSQGLVVTVIDVWPDRLPAASAASTAAVDVDEQARPPMVALAVGLDPLETLPR